MSANDILAAAPALCASGAAAEPAPVNAYDAVPYSVGAFPQTHPDRLATIATLFGLAPVPPNRCRVLELGCASAGNLIPMACALPESTFVGIDLSRRQIEIGQAAVRELGLSNLDLQTRSILEIDADFGQFDYILVHGVYSWVPPEVQDQILTICSRNLSPQGIAYVSYNTYPGWHARGAIREMIWYHCERFADPADRVREARGLLAFLVKSVPDQDAAGFGALIRRELAILQMTPDCYLLHEHLEECNEPLYFHQFAGRAAAKGLQYLAEAQISAMIPGRFGPETDKTLRAISPDLLHMEQYMDFLRNRMFRQTLLCHGGQKPDYALRPDAVMQFHIGSGAKAVSGHPDFSSSEPEQFRGPGDATLTTRDPLMKAAMLHLAQRRPLSTSFQSLVAAAQEMLAPSRGPSADDSRQLATRLLNCYTTNLVEFSLFPPSFVAHVSARPLASPYARLRAREELKVTNLRLETVALTPPSRLVLSHLDGEHDRDSLVERLTQWMTSATPADSLQLPAGQASASASGTSAPCADLPETRAAAYVDQLLQAFAHSALLIA